MIQEKKAREIAAMFCKYAKEKNVEPHKLQYINLFAAHGIDLSVSRLLEIITEIKTINRGMFEFAYEDKNKLYDYFVQFIPSDITMTITYHYGFDELRKFKKENNIV